MDVNCDERFYRAEFSPLTFFSEWNEYSLQLQNRNDFQKEINIEILRGGKGKKHLSN